MKFKAVIDNECGAGASQGQVLHVLQALERLERATERRPAERRGAPASIVLKLTNDTFAFCHRAGADEEAQTWSHFQKERLFKEYRIESKRQARIDLEAPIANLVHVFQSCASSERTAVRLANGRDGRPVLNFEFALAGNVADHRVEQEVPVRVIPDVEADLIHEPALPEPEYQIELPSSLVRLKTVLDKMRQVDAQHVVVEAAQEDDPARAASTQCAGDRKAWLRLVAEAELVTIASTFPSLTLVMEGKASPAPKGPVRLFLSLRRLNEVLAAFQLVSAEAHIACVLENRALVLYALLPNKLGSLISYTPAVVDGA
eukprot:gnl/TRDRNA2_/TRDRNA2_190514_c0_seq1.p1 gnl/TRDRNA2_/TRDRNA2_190514_c0~~gnl/TRDRNA2_/TRDRNA2_190514_c0_seq1.p1  ORF type:complete len:336 (+),score=52.95 gnl/TRDRNA2_/TRDRNA2_190514_c0_seq1:58-1008(+)